MIHHDSWSWDDSINLIYCLKKLAEETSLVMDRFRRFQEHNEILNTVMSDFRIF